MAADYQREMDFLTGMLQRMRLPVHLLHPADSLTLIDAGLRKALGLPTDDSHTHSISQQWSRERTIYKVLDQYMCHYVYFRLPGGQEPQSMVIGPYLTTDPTQEMILEQSERLGLPLQLLPQQREFYASLPVFNDPTPIMAAVACFGERLWGGPDAFHMVDVNYEQLSILPTSTAAGALIEQVNILQQMQQLEERYAYENELMEIVSHGLTNRAEVIMSSVSLLNFTSRVPDPLRNIKNYCIICNTLLRKAAQKGGVHPLYLDRLSTEYAQRIENAPTTEKAHALIGVMIRGYCRLVRTNTGALYSAAVQKALVYIDTNLSGDLSLSALASQLQLSPAYLSALFHKETGATLGAHVNAQRMRAAMQLLISTRLQVQTIAQLSGFADPNYFSRQFRRFCGVTPLQFRQEQSRPAKEV